MYDRHKPIIKWYEYDATKLYRNADAEDVTAEEESGMSAEADRDAGENVNDQQAAEEESTSMTGDPSMDDEVARIMAAFSGAKQNSVDDVFAAMAAQEEETSEDSGSSSDDNEALISSICAPRQNNVDDLVAMARGG